MTDLNKSLAASKRPAAGGDRSRSIYNNLDEKYPGLIKTPGYIRIEKKIYNGQTKYDFICTRDGNADTVTENKLDRNDKFVVTHMGLFLMKRLSTLIGAEVLQSYPNEMVFADVSTDFIGEHLEAIYNGKLGLKVGQTNFIEGMDLRRFRNVPTAQELTFNSTTSKVANSGQTEKTGFVEMTPQVTIDGNAKAMITIDAPVASSHKVAHTTSNTDNFIVLVLRGFLVTGR